jgi:hypothetical protein
LFRPRDLDAHALTQKFEFVSEPSERSYLTFEAFPYKHVLDGVHGIH